MSHIRARNGGSPAITRKDTPDWWTTSPLGHAAAPHVAPDQLERRVLQLSPVRYQHQIAWPDQHGHTNPPAAIKVVQAWFARRQTQPDPGCGWTSPTVDAGA